MAMIKKNLVVILMGVGMIVEAVGLIMFLPGSTPKVEATETADGHDDHAADSHGHGSHGGGHGKDVKKHKGKEAETVEFDLLQSDPKNPAGVAVDNRMEPGIPFSVKFKAFVTVAKEHEEEFKKKLTEKKVRIKEAVELVARRASTEVLNEPNLRTLKRQIKDAVVDLVGREKDYVQEIVLIDFIAREIP